MLSNQSSYDVVDMMKRTIRVPRRPEFMTGKDDVDELMELACGNMEKQFIISWRYCYQSNHLGLSVVANACYHLREWNE